MKKALIFNHESPRRGESFVTRKITIKTDSSKAKEILNWTPRITFEDLIKIMVDADLEAIGISPPGEGKKIISEK